ncbi:MAG TPA: pyridoxal-dependent decarboxylase [Cyclobacteriaceae bacterium]|jgi:glutamate/tyrosine decarboxylase-like PLP-dependent enzyme|nr:pyridoxal-dependent decarboxylase [Cyclobacteriaceae bacterium]
MHPLLQSDKKNISEILNNTIQIATDYFNQQESLPPSGLVDNLASAKLPEHGIGAVNVLEHFKKHYAGLMANSAGPRYFGFVTGGSTPASVAGDWLVSAFDQNACGSNDSIAPQLEHQTLDFFKQLFHLDEAYFGTFVTGATISNFVSLALGRQWIGKQRGVDFSQEGLSDSKPLKIVSATPHSSVIKSLSMSGIGRKALIKIPTLPDREAIDINELEKYLRENQEPLIVIANAGTVNTVDFDDLEAIGKLKSKYNFWLHVDAAFGGFAACSEKYAHYMKGINHADSITIDAHKWLNVPYDAAMQFTKHKDLQLSVFQNSAAYLGDPAQSPDFFHYTPENSRRFRALPSWFSLMAYGKEGHREIVERNCEAAQHFGEKINQSSTFKLLAPVRMNVVCFTFNQEDVTFDTIREFLGAVRDDGQTFFTPTVYKNIPAIRAAISNWQTELSDVNLAFEAIMGIATEVNNNNRV